MSAKNFMSYGDAETVFTDFANAIKNNTSAITAIKDGSELDSFGDVEVALLDKADTSDLGTAAAKDSTNSVTSGSTDLVESGAVKDAIDAAVAAAYHHAGTKTVAQLTHDLLIAANEGNVYNITDSGTTTSDFIEGIGKQIDAGDNVGICKVGNVYMFDLLSGLEDTSIFVQKSQTTGLLKNDGTVNTTIEDTVAEHTTAIAGKQNSTDNNLQTTDKTVVGAVNEVKSGLTNYQVQNDLNLEVPDRRNLWNVVKNVSNYRIAKQASTWSSQYGWNLRFIPIKPNTTYTIKSNTTTGSGGSGACYADTNYDSINTNALNSAFETTAQTFTTPSTAAYFVVSDIGDTPTEVELEEGTTVGSYTPYIPSVESRIEAVESDVNEINSNLTTFVNNNKAIKANSAAWPSDRLVFHIMPDNATMYHLVVSYSNNDDSFFEAYYIIRFDVGLTTKYCSNGLTLAYDDTTNNLTVTMSSGNGYYVYRNNIVATKEG